MQDSEARNSEILSYDDKNMQLFGILSVAVVPDIRTTLFLHHSERGRQAILWLEHTYGQVDANDATAATIRVYLPDIASAIQMPVLRSPAFSASTTPCALPTPTW